MTLSTQFSASAWRISGYNSGQTENRAVRTSSASTGLVEAVKSALDRQAADMVVIRKHGAKLLTPGVRYTADEIEAGS